MRSSNQNYPVLPEQPEFQQFAELEIPKVLMVNEHN